MARSTGSEGSWFVPRRRNGNRCSTSPRCTSPTSCGAFVYDEPQNYEEVEPAWLLSRVVREHVGDKDWFDLVHPHRPEPDEIRVEWTDSATKNGISRERSEHVVKHWGLRFKEHRKTLFVGVDLNGTELEVVAVGDDDYGEAFVVFHAAEMRPDYRGLLARAER